MRCAVLFRQEALLELTAVWGAWQAKNMRLPVLALACLATVALSAVVVLTQRASAVSLSQYPKAGSQTLNPAATHVKIPNSNPPTLNQSDIGMLKVMQSMATAQDAPAQAAPVAAAHKAHGKGDLSMPQQVTLSG